MIEPNDDIRADPPLESWAARLAFGPIDERSERFRAELGLPTDAPIVMTGHQPTFWHPGILAKYLAADALAEITGAKAAWLVVDQDAVDPFAIEAPVRTQDGALGSQTVRLATAPGEGLAAASSPPERPLALDPGTRFALPGIRDRLGRVIDSLSAHASESSAAKQTSRANAQALSRVLPERPIVFASDLRRTTLFAELVEAMRKDPEKALRAYNTASAEFPEAGIALLRSDDLQDIHELPLWSIAPGAPRRRVYHHDLDEIDPDTLAPRALLVTAMMRLAGCELFIHGTGGAVYDRVTERWFREWLGVTLAPKAAITADLRLQLDVPTVTPEDVAKASWLAHSAKHNPGLLGDTTAQHAKDALLATIEDARARGEDPSEMFQKIHELRRTFAFAHASELAGLAKDAADLERRAAESAVASRRDWPATLYPDDQLVALRDSVRERMARGVERSTGKKHLSPSRAR